MENNDSIILELEHLEELKKEIAYLGELIGDLEKFVAAIGESKKDES